MHFILTQVVKQFHVIDGQKEDELLEDEKVQDGNVIKLQGTK